MRYRALITIATIVAASTVAGAQTAEARLPTCTGSAFQYAGGNWYIDNPNLFDTFNHRCILRYGDSFRDPENSPVMTLQRTLNYCYRTKLVIDGIYGPLTRAAVMRVQRLHRITVDGVYGPQTRSAMFWRMYRFEYGPWSQRCYSPF
jgi:murein L,D-transpeptidase YcbB/YkuD